MVEPTVVITIAPAGTAHQADGGNPRPPSLVRWALCGAVIFAAWLTPSPLPLFLCRALRLNAQLLRN